MILFYINNEGCGEIKFLVYLDDKLAYDSGNMYASSDTQTINISVEGINKLKLVVDSGENNYWDHADWAGARLTTYKTTGTKLYEYDSLNKLKKVTEGTNKYTYTYGGNGLRLTKTVNGVGSIHVWDGQQMVAELHESGSVVSKYIRGINQIYMQDSDGVKKFYLFNGHGDVIHLTNTSGNVIKTYDYDAFGVEKNADLSDVNPFRYCGEYFDKETGTIYLRARYYNPVIGRFISADSYAGEPNDPLSLNLYTYCKNNPVNAWDPTGHYTVYELLQKIQGYKSSAASLTSPHKQGLLDDATYNKTLAELHCKADYIRSCILASTELMSTSSFKNEELIKLVKVYFFESDGKTLRANGQTEAEMDALLKAASNTTTDEVFNFLVSNQNKWLGIDNHTVDYNADIAICFTGDTFVYTKEGNRPIKDVKIGDEVFSENPETGEKGLKQVKNIFVHETNMILHVVAGNEDIKTTETHPFWVVGKGWTSAGKLKQGDRLLIYSGEYLTVTNVKIEVLSNPIKVYNFEVEGWHTYFVSISNILVHNTCSLFVPNNSGWTPAGTNMTTWISQNGYKAKIGQGTDIGKLIIQDAKGTLLGEIHVGQIVKRGPNRGSPYQQHYQRYVNGATDPNHHLYFED